MLHDGEDEDGEDEDDAGFRILSSQTYIRPATQTQAADDTNSSWQDTWLPGQHHEEEQAEQPAVAAQQTAAVEDEDDEVVSLLTQVCVHDIRVHAHVQAP